jgi:hypothetical protein
MKRGRRSASLQASFVPDIGTFPVGTRFEYQLAREPGETTVSFRVLVTGAATPAGRSMMEALRCDSVTLLACDCEAQSPTDIPPQQRFCVHPSDDPEFVGDLLTLCVLHDVDVLVPLRESDQLALTKVPHLFERFGARVWLAPIPAHATRSHARRILQLGERGRAKAAVSNWFRRLSGLDTEQPPAPL